MYKVYGTIRSRALRVLWMLEEIGEAYEFVEAGSHSKEVLALNPSGKVPILEVEGAVITDSTAILTYLADKHGKLTHPAGTVSRAHQDGLTFALLDEFDSVLWTATRHKFYLPEDQRAENVIPSLEWEFERHLTRMSRRFAGPFLMGDEMTIADIICAHCLNWAKNMKFPILPENLEVYRNQMTQRRAFRAVLALANN